MLIEYGFYLWPCLEKWASMKVNTIVHFEMSTSFHIWKFYFTLDASVYKIRIDLFQFGNTILLAILVTSVSNSYSEF